MKYILTFGLLALMAMLCLNKPTSTLPGQHDASYQPHAPPGNALIANQDQDNYTTVQPEAATATVPARIADPTLAAADTSPPRIGEMPYALQRLDASHGYLAPPLLC